MYRIKKIPTSSNRSAGYYVVKGEGSYPEVVSSHSTKADALEAKKELNRAHDAYLESFLS